MGRFFLTLLLGVAIFGLGAWQLDLFTTGAEHGKLRDDLRPNLATPPEKLGAELYPKVPDKKLSPGRVAGRDPVVVHGHMNVMEKVNVPSPVTGQLLFIGTEVPEGAAQVAGVAAFLGEDYYFALINQGDSKLVHFYRRLYEGNVVTKDQMVSLVDPARALGELNRTRRKMSYAIQDEKVAAAGARTAIARLNRASGLKANNNMAQEEYDTYVLAEIKYSGEQVMKKIGVNVAEEENRMSEIVYRQHEVRNKIPKQRCQIQAIYRDVSAGVREQESILELWNLDRLLAEAQVPVQYLPRLSNSRVRIEPVQEQDPYRQLKSHKKDVNAVAVGGNEKDPLILSASEDKSVCVWSPTANGPVLVLDHAHPVRAVACTAPGAKVQYWLTGDSEGNVAFWNLAKEPAEQKIELPNLHKDAITSLAISASGQFFATGGANGAIYLYTVEDGPAFKYGFDAEHGVEESHRGPVTSLTFTPQSRLVSASRDQTLRVWNLREKGVFLQGKILENRAGSVTNLGVSADGGWMLFDQGKDLQILSVLDGRTLNTLHNPAGSIPFETLALFSADAKMLLTVGVGEGRLQLWRAPTEAERGYEIRQLVPPLRSTVTCAAFSSYPGLGGAAPFVVSGTKDGYVYLWTLPTQLEVESHRMDNARLKLVTPNIDAGGNIRVGVEVVNPATADFPQGRFRPGQPVTIVFE